MDGGGGGGGGGAGVELGVDVNIGRRDIPGVPGGCMNPDWDIEEPWSCVVTIMAICARNRDNSSSRAVIFFKAHVFVVCEFPFFSTILFID